MLQQQIESGDPSAAIPDGTVLCQGFGGLLQRHNHKSASVSSKEEDCSLHWYYAPDEWQPLPGKREGRDGRWSVADDENALTLVAPAKKDYWRRTYYDPPIVKDDAPFVYAVLNNHQNYTVSTRFALTAVSQFDQAGIMIRLDEQHWLKTGIEVVDHVPRLSVVVTNVFSDWSTQQFASTGMDEMEDGKKITTVHCRIRVHCRGESFVVEAQRPNQDEWEMVRIAHLSRNMISASSHSGDSELQKNDADKDKVSTTTLMAGVFAACPEDQRGAVAVFDEFSIVVGSHFDHNADNNN